MFEKLADWATGCITILSSYLTKLSTEISGIESESDIWALKAETEYTRRLERLYAIRNSLDDETLKGDIEDLWDDVTGVTGQYATTWGIEYTEAKKKLTEYEIIAQIKQIKDGMFRK